MAWVYFVGDAPANNTHISSILSIATFTSAPVHILGCHVGRQAAKCTLMDQNKLNFGHITAHHART